MNDQRAPWWLPLSGLLLVLLGVVTILIVGQSPDATEDSAREIVQYYDDNATAEGIGVSIAVLIAGLLVAFGATVRQALRAAQPDVDGDLLPAIAFAGTIIFASGLAFDATLTITLIETSDDISPAATQALSALYGNDFIPFAVGLMLFLLGTGLSVLRHGALPKWLGWVAIVLAVLCPTPVGFVGFLGGLLVMAVVSVMLALRARSAAAGPAAAA